MSDVFSNHDSRSIEDKSVMRSFSFNYPASGVDAVVGVDLDPLQRTKSMEHNSYSTSWVGPFVPYVFICFS